MGDNYQLLHFSDIFGAPNYGTSISPSKERSPVVEVADRRRYAHKCCQACQSLVVKVLGSCNIVL
ncbi:hypothetical protein [Nostoc sp.]|uniref:hypothetical protein n=1 Tax=Nostoc sp. TaxID=1180 RepID=UPI002FFCBB03